MGFSYFSCKIFFFSLMVLIFLEGSSGVVFLHKSLNFSFELSVHKKMVCVAFHTSDLKNVKKKC